jgi:hypothetical protein
VSIDDQLIYLFKHDDDKHGNISFVDEKYLQEQIKRQSKMGNIMKLGTNIKIIDIPEHNKCHICCYTSEKCTIGVIIVCDNIEQSQFNYECNNCLATSAILNDKFYINQQISAHLVRIHAQIVSNLKQVIPLYILRIRCHSIFNVNLYSFNFKHRAMYLLSSMLNTICCCLQTNRTLEQGIRTATRDSLDDKLGQPQLQQPQPHQHPQLQPPSVELIELPDDDGDEKEIEIDSENVDESGSTSASASAESSASESESSSESSSELESSESAISA